MKTSRKNENNYEIIYSFRNMSMLLYNHFAKIMLMKNNLHVWFFVLVSSEKSITKQNIYHKPFHKINFIYLKCQFKIPVQMNVNLFRFTCLLFPKQLLSGLVFTFGNISERCRCILHFYLHISKYTQFRWPLHSLNFTWTL